MIPGGRKAEKLLHETKCILFLDFSGTRDISADTLQVTDEETGDLEAQKIRDAMDRGEIDWSQAMEATGAIVGQAFTESRKSARRARMRHQWKAEGNYSLFDEDFGENEGAALEALKKTEFFASFRDLSDEEEEQKSNSEAKSTGNGGTGEENDGEDMEEDEDDVVKELVMMMTTKSGRAR